MQRNPFEELEDVFEEMSERFERMNEGRGERFAKTAVDISENDEAFTVTADLPGFERDDIELRIVDNVLHIEAERETETEAEDEEEEYLRRERTHRSVSRSIRLPADVDEENAEAGFENGVLTVTLPKEELEEEESTEIPIV